MAKPVSKATEKIRNANKVQKKAEQKFTKDQAEARSYRRQHPDDPLGKNRKKS